MAQRYSIQLSAFAVMALASCGGGGGGTGTASSGGGSGSSSNFDGFSQIGPNDEATLTGQAVLADFTFNADGDIVDISNLDDGSATVELVYRDGKIVAMRGSAPGTSFDVDPEQGDFLSNDVPLNPDVVVGQDNAGNAVVGFFKAVPQEFEYQSLVSWQRLNAPGKFAAASVGTRTATSGMPSGGTATYSGVVVGLSDIDGIVGETEAILLATTDFSSVTLDVRDTVKITGAAEVRTPAPDHDVSGTLIVNGNEFSGTVTADVGSGNAFGSFFGPNAQEIGGFFGVEGGSGEYIGAFGASR